jgi:hypothetical protein
MNINSSIARVLDALTFIELAGDKNKRLSAEDVEFLMSEISRARRELNEYREKHLKDDTHDLNTLGESLSARCSTSIVMNGIGGINRYAVRGDGTVEFSRYHSTRPHIRAAIEQNFSTY